MTKSVRLALQKRESRARTERKLRVIVNAIRQKGCVDCKIKNVAFHFDHRNPSTKVNAVCRYRFWAPKPLTLFLQEIAKCDCVCIPCHKQRTLMRRDKPPIYTKTMLNSIERERRLIKTIEYCQCGCLHKLNPNDVEFHHIDPDTKIASVTSLRKSPEKHQQELLKCKIVTSKCHREITKSYYDNKIGSFL